MFWLHVTWSRMRGATRQTRHIWVEVLKTVGKQLENSSFKINYNVYDANTLLIICLALSTVAFDIEMSNVKIQGTAITHQHRITVSAPVSSLCDLCHQLTANSPSTKWVVTQTPNVKCSNQFFQQPFIFVDKRYLFVSCRSVIVLYWLPI